MDTLTENAGEKQGGRFRPGQSGNPAGRPKGARNRATMAAEALLDGEAEALTRKAVDLALEGDVTALRLCLERLLPPRKDRPVSVDLPPMAGPEDVQGATGAILAAVAAGEITPSEATALMGIVEGYRRAVAPEPAQPLIAPTIHVQFVGHPG